MHKLLTAMYAKLPYTVVAGAVRIHLDGCAGRQLQREVAGVDGDRLIRMGDFDELVLGKSPSLHDQISRLAGIQVDQVNTGALGVELVDQATTPCDRPGPACSTRTPTLHG